VHRRVEVRALDAVGELAGHLEGDPVSALGAVQGDAGDPPVGFIGDCPELFHGLLLL